MNKSAVLKLSQRCAIANNASGILFGLGIAKHWAFFLLSLVAMFISFHYDANLQDELFGVDDMDDGPIT